MLKIKDVKGWEDYTIDTDGNIFSKRKNKYLKQTINKYGYCKVTLQKNKYKKMYSVHRLVAETFVANPKNLPQVNHIDSDRTNNNINNLEWVNAKENTQHALKNNRFESMAKINSEKMKRNKIYLKGVPLANKAVKKKVSQYDENGILINTYKSITEASKNTAISIQSINQVCRNKRKKAGGYIWHYA